MGDLYGGVRATSYSPVQTYTNAGIVVHPDVSAPMGLFNTIRITVANRAAKLYINGIEAQANIGGASSVLNQANVMFGDFTPAMDAKYEIDYVRWTTHFPLTPDNLTTYNPIPLNEMPAPKDVVLRWIGGTDSKSYDVYLGTDYDSVANAQRLAGDLNGDTAVDSEDLLPVAQHWLANPIGSQPYVDLTDDLAVNLEDFAVVAADWHSRADAVYKGNYTGKTYDTTYSDPCGLQIGTTYYWRIDGVKEPNTYKGDVWSFTPVLSFAPDALAMLETPGQSVKIVCLGDSITASSYDGGLSYPERLQLYLSTNYPQASVTTINAGISSDATSRMLARLQSDVLDHDPDLVTVMAGVNDTRVLPPGCWWDGFADRCFDGTENWATKEEFHDNLVSIVQQCQDVGAEVILLIENSIDTLPQWSAETWTEYSRVVVDVGGEMDVPVVDYYSIWESIRDDDPLDWQAVMLDQLHPNSAGHKVFAEKLIHSIIGQRVSLE